MTHVIISTLLVLGTVSTMSAVSLFLTESTERDFGAFYASLTSFWSGGTLYVPHTFINLNAPHVSVVLFSPLIVFDYPMAAALWVGISAVCLTVSVWLIRDELHLSTSRLYWMLAILLPSSALVHHWRQGQVGTVLMLLVTLAWRAERRQSRSASWWLAAATSLKPWLALVILVQRPRAAFITIAIGVAGVAVGIILLGPGLWIEWITTMQAQATFSWPANLGVFGTLLRVTGHSMTETSIVSPLVRPIWLLGSGVVLLLTWRARHGSMDRAWLLWTLAGILVSPVAWTYYLLAIVGPLMAWGEAQRWPTRVRIAVALLLVPSGVVMELWTRWPVLGSFYMLPVLLLWGTALAQLHQAAWPVAIRTPLKAIDA